jgi:hypothetical protein
VDGHWHSVLLALVEQPPVPLDVLVDEVLEVLVVLVELVDPPVAEVEVELVLPVPVTVLLLPVPLPVLLQAPRLAPSVQPKIAPAISQPFFMKPS